MLPDNELPEDLGRANLEARVTNLNAFLTFLLRAYSALRHYGIDYQSLPEYHKDEELERAFRLTPQRGSEVILKWIAKLEHGLTAAIRRKHFRDVNRKE